MWIHSLFAVVPILIRSILIRVFTKQFDGLLNYKSIVNDADIILRMAIFLYDFQRDENDSKLVLNGLCVLQT